MPVFIPVFETKGEQMRTPDISKLCRGLLAGDSLEALDAEGPRKGEYIAQN